MKLYSLHPAAHISMGDSPELRALLRTVIREEAIDRVVESGTYDGSGSTTMLAEAFSSAAPPRRFVTLEANGQSWSKAKANLQRFPFVTPVWGLSVALDEALDFLRTDPCLSDHARWPDIWIDDVDDPLAFYTAETRGQLGGQTEGSIDAHQGEDLLRRELRAAAGSQLLVALDSAGGIGYLEFQILRAELAGHSYVLLLDDIHHLKHFRSLREVRADSAFTVLGINEEAGWVLVKHAPTR